MCCRSRSCSLHAEVGECVVEADLVVSMLLNLVTVGPVRLLELCNKGVATWGEQLEVDVQLRGQLVPAVNHLILDGESVALDNLLKEAFLLAGVDHQRVVALLGEVCRCGGQEKGKEKATRGNNGQDFWTWQLR